MDHTRLSNGEILRLQPTQPRPYPWLGWVMLIVITAALAAAVELCGWLPVLAALGLAQ